LWLQEVSISFVAARKGAGLLAALKMPYKRPKLGPLSTVQIMIMATLKMDAVSDGLGAMVSDGLGAAHSVLAATQKWREIFKCGVLSDFEERAIRSCCCCVCCRL